MNTDVQPDAPPDALGRFRRWAGIAVALAAFGYLCYALVRGLQETTTELMDFWWLLYLPVLALTLVNYGLRFFKWHYLLRRLGIEMPVTANLQVFAAGLAMVISPGKAGEVVKPYLVRVISGAPFTKTLPALIAERVTDGIAVVILAAIGISTYYADGTRIILTALGVIGAGLVVIAIRPLSLSVLALVRLVPFLRGIADRLEHAYEAMRTCLAPVPLAVTMIASLIAWWAECIGYWLIFKGLGVEASLDASTFLYAFATVFGAPSPGGMGMSDVALTEGALGILPGLTAGQAVASTLLIRIATLWFGVALGALALLRVESIISTARETLARPRTGSTP